MNEMGRRLVQLFERYRVMDIETIQRLMEGRSRRSVFRDLNREQYLTSYTHAGGYYTLQAMPEFDSEGLWRYGDIGFSRYGTLRNTTVEMINGREEGGTHGELEARLRVRLHNTLLDLIRSTQIGREKVGRLYVYVSADHDRASFQLQRRRRMGALATRAAKLPPLSIRIEVFAEIIRTSASRIDTAGIESRLARRGIAAPVEQIERMMERYDIKKNAV